MNKCVLDKAIHCQHLITWWRDKQKEKKNSIQTSVVFLISQSIAVRNVRTLMYVDIGDTISTKSLRSNRTFINKRLMLDFSLGDFLDFIWHSSLIYDIKVAFIDSCFRQKDVRLPFVSFKLRQIFELVSCRVFICWIKYANSLLLSDWFLRLSLSSFFCCAPSSSELLARQGSLNLHNNFDLIITETVGDGQMSRTFLFPIHRLNHFAIPFPECHGLNSPQAED